MSLRAITAIAPATILLGCDHASTQTFVGTWTLASGTSATSCAGGTPPQIALAAGSSTLSIFSSASGKAGTIQLTNSDWPARPFDATTVDDTHAIVSTSETCSAGTNSLTLQSGTSTVDQARTADLSFTSTANGSTCNSVQTSSYA